MTLNKDFRDTRRQDIAKLLERIERMDRSERTKREYKLLIRRFYRWLGKSGAINWITIPSGKKPEKLPEDLLSVDDIKKMINRLRK